jgi:hypothetical protein
MSSLQFFPRLFASLALAAIFTFNVRAHGAETTLQTRADEITRLFSADPGHYEQVFAPSFMAAVPASQLSFILRKTFEQLGRCINANRLKSNTPFSGEFQFEFEKGFSSHVSLVIDRAPPHLVTGFFIGPPLPVAKSIDEMITQLKSLPGGTSLFVATIEPGGLRPIAQLNAEKPLAIGSAFKLYVLGELIRELAAQERHWTDVVPLDDTARSLPSGFLRDWPVGSPLTIHTLAALMISQSDNTAADELIRLLGRDRIQKMLGVTGQMQPQLNVPFLTTLEMFKLKGDRSGKLMAGYLAANPADRLKLLNGPVAQFSRDAIEIPATPSHIADVEWFASTSDLGRVMKWIRDQTADDRTSAARQILAINPGLEVSKEQWKYIGYKGGSERGVLNLTYLLEASDNRWFTVSATWNDPEKVLDESRFFGLVERILQLTH